jgi:hypothetical protein
MNQQQQKPMGARNLQNLMDLINHEAVNYKVTKHYSSQIQDTNAKRVVDDVCAHHKQSFDALDQYLNNPV